MAITVRDTFISKNRHHCVSNRCDVLYSSTNQISTIVVSAATTTRLSQFIMDTAIDGTVYKDLAPVFNRYMSYDFNSTDLAWIAAPNSTNTFNVTATDTNTTGTTTSTIISAVTVENSWLFTKDWIESTHKSDDYKICVVGTEHKIAMLNNYVFHVNAYTSELRYIQVDVYNAAGLTGSYFLPGPTSGYTTQRYMIDVGTFNLAQQFGVQIFNSGATHYNVSMKITGGTLDSKVHRFNLDFGCNNDSIRIHWLNSKGGFNAANLVTGVKEVRNNDKNTYTRKNYSVDPTSLTIKDNTLNRYSYYTNKSRDWTSTSDWMTEEESAAFVELYESPVTILEVNNIFYSCTVDAKKTPRHSYVDNAIISYDVTINLQDDKFYTI